MHVNKNGYLCDYKPDHPSSHKWGRIYVHNLIAEKVLGRSLNNGEVVHHHSKKPDNSQLVICENNKYHKLLHIRTRALRACGNANYRKCWICKEYDDPKNLIIKERNDKCRGDDIFHRTCRKEYQRKYYHKQELLRSGRLYWRQHHPAP